MATTFEEILQRDGVLMYRTKGVSMLPLIREGRDLMIVESIHDKALRITDVVLFKRKNGDYVLHRLMWQRNGKYVIIGDNLWDAERWISRSQILGVMTAVVRGGRRIEMSSIRMKCYSWLMWLTYPVRAVLLYAVRSVWPRIKRKIFGK